MCDKKSFAAAAAYSTTSTECCKQNAEGERKELAAAMTELNGNDRTLEKKKRSQRHTFIH